MSESQFEKLLKTLKTVERERDLAKHTVEVQDGIINELRKEISVLSKVIQSLMLIGRGEDDGTHSRPSN